MCAYVDMFVVMFLAESRRPRELYDVNADKGNDKRRECTIPMARKLVGKNLPTSLTLGRWIRLLMRFFFL